MDIASSMVGFALGVASGLILEHLRQRRSTYLAVRDSYLGAMNTAGVNEDEYLRFGALQRAGAWLLSAKQLQRLSDDITGRGFNEPSEIWRNAFPSSADFPKCALLWAKDKNVDFTKPDAALRALARDWDATRAPKVPIGAGVMFLD